MVGNSGMLDVSNIKFKWKWTWRDRPSVVAFSECPMWCTMQSTMSCSESEERERERERESGVLILSQIFILVPQHIQRVTILSV